MAITDGGLSSDHLKRYDPRFLPIERARYMEVYNKIRHLRAPRMRVFTAELAKAVNGVGEGLPEWATDESLDSELSKLIEQNPYVWICSSCDSIASFYSDSGSAMCSRILSA